MVPTPLIERHIWKDGGSNISYDVAAIHTIERENEAAYGECAKSNQNEGFAAPVFSCLSMGKISEEVQNQRQKVQGSPWVSRWLVEDYGGSLSSSSKFKLIYLAPIIGGVIVIVGLVGLIVFIKRRRSKNADETNAVEENPSTPNVMYHGCSDTDNQYNSSLGRRTIGTADDRETVSSIRTTNKLDRRMSAYERDLSSESNVTLKVLLDSKHLVGKHIPYESITFQRALSKGANGEVWLGDEKCRFVVVDQGQIDIAVGTASALEYIHSRSPPLIHRDLKSKNILLTRQLVPKLIDFGVSRGREEFSMTAGVGTPYWTAPEILEGKRYTEQADIYSFGVVLSELDTGKLPYHDALTPEGTKPKPFLILSDVMAGMLRPNFSDECPANIRRCGVLPAQSGETSDRSSCTSNASS